MADYKLDADPGQYRVAGSSAEFNVIGTLVGRLRGGQLGALTLAAQGTVGDSPTGPPPTQTIHATGTPSTTQVWPPVVGDYPAVLLRAVVVNLGDQTDDGPLVEGVSVAWFEIVKELARDADFLFKVPWRKLEELIAGAYERDGWPEVVLTPRSGDRGRDVIATKPGIGSIRIFDQVKAYAPGHRVAADEVRSLLATLEVERNVSKGVLTTSSEFAPGILKNSGLAGFMPNRLELKDGASLLRWLSEIAGRSRGR